MTQRLSRLLTYAGVIVLVGIGPDLKPTCESVLWTRPGYVEAANVS